MRFVKREREIAEDIIRVNKSSSTINMNLLIERLSVVLRQLFAIHWDHYEEWGSHPLNRKSVVTISLQAAAAAAAAATECRQTTNIIASQKKRDFANCKNKLRNRKAFENVAVLHVPDGIFLFASLDQARKACWMNRHIVRSIEMAELLIPKKKSTVVRHMCQSN